MHQLYTIIFCTSINDNYKQRQNTVMGDNSQDTSNQFPIRELSARTQVNTVTLRAWERRYGLLKPERSSKGHRLYCEADVATIEKVIALVARGVPLGKVKPLLAGNMPTSLDVDETENWLNQVMQLTTAVESFSISKVEHQIQQSFANYPVPICRERLMEPALAALAQRDDNGAACGFMENELIRYSLMRLSAKVSHKKMSPTVVLIPGHQTPIWRLALMALELADVKFSVHLLTQAFSVAAGIELADKFKDASTVFYQDGTWKAKEQELANTALNQSDNLQLCGTAPVLALLDNEQQVFRDIQSCIDGLLKSQ